MTLTAEPQVVPPDAEPARAAAARCHRCGASMDTDQEWCLECGEAHTLVHSPPDWRIGVAIVAVVVVLALAGFAIALINLSENASSSAARGVTAAPAPAASTAAPTSTAKAIPGWPSGRAGYTVVLSSSATQAAARSAAARLSLAGVPLGILDSSAHPRMRPGQWIVFTGHFPTHAAARVLAVRLRARGISAQAHLVG